MKHFIEFSKKHSVDSDLSKYDGFVVNKLKTSNWVDNVYWLKRKAKYKKYILSRKWKKKTRRIKRVCWVCGSEKHVTIHHRIYKNLYKEKRSDLIPLCWDCHKSVHNLVINEHIDLYNAHITYKNLYYLNNDIRYTN